MTVSSDVRVGRVRGGELMFCLQQFAIICNDSDSYITRSTKKKEKDAARRADARGCGEIEYGWIFGHLLAVQLPRCLIHLSAQMPRSDGGRVIR